MRGKARVSIVTGLLKGSYGLLFLEPRIFTEL